MKPDYSHTYRTCAYSMKRKNAPWRVTGGCGSRDCLHIGRHHELPSYTVCFTCPFYVKEAKHDKSEI